MVVHWLRTKTWTFCLFMFCAHFRFRRKRLIFSVQLSHFAESLLEYHKNCAEVLQSLTVKLSQKMNEASARPRVEFMPKTLEDLGIDRINSFDNLNTTAKRPSQLSSQTSFSSTHSSGNNFAATSALISTSPSPSPSVTPTRLVRLPFEYNVRGSNPLKWVNFDSREGSKDS